MKRFFKVVGIAVAACAYFCLSLGAFELSAQLGMAMLISCSVVPWWLVLTGRLRLA